MQRQFQSGKTFTFGLYPAENQQWRLQLTPPDSEQPLISSLSASDAAAPQTLKLTAQSAAPQGERRHAAGDHPEPAGAEPAGGATARRRGIA